MRNRASGASTGGLLDPASPEALHERAALDQTTAAAAAGNGADEASLGFGGKSIGKMAKGEYETLMSVDPKKDPKTIDKCTRAACTRARSKSASISWERTSGPCA